MTQTKWSHLLTSELNIEPKQLEPGSLYNMLTTESSWDRTHREKKKENHSPAVKKDFKIIFPEKFNWKLIRSTDQTSVSMSY